MLADANLVEWISGAKVLPAFIYSTNDVLSDITVAKSALDAEHHTSISLIVVEVVSEEDSGLHSEVRCAWNERILVGAGFCFSPDRNDGVSCEFYDISSKVDDYFDLFHARVGIRIAATDRVGTVPWLVSSSLTIKILLSLHARLTCLSK